MGVQRDEALTAHSAEAERLAARQAELEAQRRALDEQQAACEARDRKLPRGRRLTRRNCSECVRNSNLRGPRWPRNAASGSRSATKP